jgi:hypothetical protein
MFTYTVKFLKPRNSTEFESTGDAMSINRINPIAKDDLLRIAAVNLAPSSEWIGRYLIWRVATVLHVPDPINPMNEGSTLLYVQPFSESETFKVTSVSIVL